MAKAMRDLIIWGRFLWMAAIPLRLGIHYNNQNDKQFQFHNLYLSGRVYAPCRFWVNRDTLAVGRPLPVFTR